jgi:hypothetical protein
VAAEQDEGAGPAGDERLHLRAAARVVKQQQHPVAGSPIAPQGRSGLQAWRDLHGRDPGAQQEGGKRFGRFYRFLPGSVPVEAQEHLPVGELIGERVGHVDRQCRLSDAGHSIDGDDLRGASRAYAAENGLRQAGYLRGPAGERGDVARQRMRRRRQGLD